MGVGVLIGAAVVVDTEVVEPGTTVGWGSSSQISSSLTESKVRLGQESGLVCSASAMTLPGMQLCNRRTAQLLRKVVQVSVPVVVGPGVVVEGSSVVVGPGVVVKGMSVVVGSAVVVRGSAVVEGSVVTAGSAAQSVMASSM